MPNASPAQVSPSARNALPAVECLLADGVLLAHRYDPSLRPARAPAICGSSAPWYIPILSWSGSSLGSQT